MSGDGGGRGGLQQGWQKWVKRSCSGPDCARCAYAGRRVHDDTEDTPVMCSMRTNWMPYMRAMRITCKCMGTRGQHATVLGVGYSEIFGHCCCKVLAFAKPGGIAGHTADVVVEAAAVNWLMCAGVVDPAVRCMADPASLAAAQSISSVRG